MGHRWACCTPGHCPNPPGCLKHWVAGQAALQGAPLSPTSAQHERCVPPELCPCRHGGQWYPPNATIQEDCNVWYA